MTIYEENEIFLVAIEEKQTNKKHPQPTQITLRNRLKWRVQF